MTEKELSRYYYLKREIKDLEDRLKELGVGLSAINLDKELSSGSSGHTSIQEKIAIIKEKWINARLSALEEYLKIENYIETVEEVEIRQIMRYRFLDLLSWEKVAEKMNYERTTIPKKLRSYLRKQ